MKKQEKQKQKIKEVLLKILRIVSYVLSLAFIGLCILTGVQSCSNNKAPKTIQDTSNTLRVSNRPSLNDFSNYYVYYSLFLGGEQIVNYNFQKNLADYYDIPFNQAVSSDSSSMYITADLTNCYLFKNGELNQTTLFFAVYSVFPSDNSGTSYRYRLNYCSFRTSEGDLLYTQKVANYYNDYNYNFYNFSSNNAVRLVFSEEVAIDNYLFSSFFAKGDSTTTFAFNDQINYNAPLGRTLDSPIVPYGSASGEFYFVDYNVFFISGGQLFDRIRIAYQNANGSAYVEKDNNTPKVYSGTGSYTYAFMTYDNTITNVSISVNSRDLVQYSPSSSSTGWYMANSSTWSSQIYKVVNFLNINEQKLIEITKLNNNIYGNTDISNNNVYLGGVFDLLRMAFGSITGLMSISVLPGLSLGLFVFLPLVVTIILLIFKAVRK